MTALLAFSLSALMIGTALLSGVFGMAGGLILIGVRGSEGGIFCESEGLSF